MHSQFDFDNTYNSESLNTDRNVLNRAEGNSNNLIFHSKKSIGDDSVSDSINDPGIKSIAFTDESVDFMSPYEDLDLISGTKVPVARNASGEVVNSSDYEHRIYDPMQDKTWGTGTVNLNSLNYKNNEKYSKESFGIPDFYTNKTDLIILCIILLAVIVIEIIGLVAVL